MGLQTSLTFPATTMFIVVCVFVNISRRMRDCGTGVIEMKRATNNPITTHQSVNVSIKVIMIVNIHYGLLVFIANRQGCARVRRFFLRFLHIFFCCSFANVYSAYEFYFFCAGTCFRKYFNELGKHFAMKIFYTRFCFCLSSVVP